MIDLSFTFIFAFIFAFAGSFLGVFAALGIIWAFDRP